MAEYYQTLDGNYRLRLSVNTASQNVAGNSSTVQFALVLEKIGTFSRWSGYSTNSWSVSINGSNYSGTTTYDFRNYGSLTLLNWTTLSVPHNPDGTKSISVSGSWNDAINAIPDGTASGTYTLSSLPRTSMPRLSQSHTDAGSQVTIYTDRASTGFTHEIQVFFGTIGTSIVSNVGDSYVWTIPLSYLNEMPDTDRMFGTLRLRTFSGSTDLGYKDIVFAIRAGSTIVPTITAVTATEATAGLAANVGTGKFVQNITTLDVATSGAAGVYGSTIASTKIEVAGQTINAASGKTAPINASGTVNVVATVTDTRGKTASKTLALTVTPYSAPQISNISVYRSTSGGVAQEDGTYVTVQFTGSVSSIMNTTERNARSYQIRSFDRTTNAWAVKQAFVAVTGVSSTVTRYLTPYSAENSFDFEIAVKDDFMTSSALRTVSVAKVFMHWNGSAGMGIGKYHNKGALDVGGDIYMNDVKVRTEEVHPHFLGMRHTGFAVPNGVWTPVTFSPAGTFYTSVGLNFVTDTATILKGGLYTLTASAKFTANGGGNSRAVAFKISTYGADQLAESNLRVTPMITATVPVNTSWTGPIPAGATVQMVLVQNSGVTSNAEAMEFGISYLGPSA